MCNRFSFVLGCGAGTQVIENCHQARQWPGQQCETFDYQEQDVPYYRLLCSKYVPAQKGAYSKIVTPCANSRCGGQQIDANQVYLPRDEEILEVDGRAVVASQGVNWWHERVAREENAAQGKKMLLRHSSRRRLDDLGVQADKDWKTSAKKSKAP